MSEKEIALIDKALRLLAERWLAQNGLEADIIITANEGTKE